MASTTSVQPSRPTWRRQLVRAIFIVVGIEVGLLLLTLPWTRLWDHSLWMTPASASLPASLGWLGSVLRSDYLRGAVSGLGLVNLWIAASEITGFRL